MISISCRRVLGACFLAFRSKDSVKSLGRGNDALGDRDPSVFGGLLILRFITQLVASVAALSFAAIGTATSEPALDQSVLPLPAPAPTTTYTVKKGDNDWSLAKKFGITVKELHKLNPNVNFKKLQIGTKLVVPGQAEKPAAKKAPAKTTPKPQAKQVKVELTGEKAEVIKSDVILRAGPGTKFERRARLNKGQKASVIERRDGWTKVKFASGTIGWMRDDMVAVTGTKTDLIAKKEDSDAVLPDTPESGTAKAGDATIDPKSVKEVESSAKEDLADTTPKKEIATSVVTPPPLEPAVDPREEVDMSAFNGKVARITASNVIVRSGPGTDTARKTMVGSGRVADILAMQGDWYKVKFGGGTIGWVRNDLLELVSADLVAKEREAASAGLSDPDASKVEKVLATARSKMGTRYVYGASRSNAFDCSGFVVWVMGQHGVKGLPRTSASQSTYGKKVARGDLEAGDLVFFRTTRGRRVSHVGIYIGNNKFIHASSGGGKVQINSLGESYYNARYVTARRLPQLSK